MLFPESPPGLGDSQYADTCPARILDHVREDETGATRLWTTRILPACGTSSVEPSAGGGAEGRYILIGVCRIVAPGGFRNLVLM